MQILKASRERLREYLAQQLAAGQPATFVIARSLQLGRQHQVSAMEMKFRIDMPAMQCPCTRRRRRRLLCVFHAIIPDFVEFSSLYVINQLVDFHKRNVSRFSQDSGGMDSMERFTPLELALHIASSTSQQLGNDGGSLRAEASVCLLQQQLDNRSSHCGMRHHATNIYCC